MMFPEKYGMIKQYKINILNRGKKNLELEKHQL